MLLIPKIFEMDTDLSALNLRFEQQAKWTFDFQRKLFHDRRTPPPWKILEVGCGTGAVLRQMGQMGSVNDIFYGIDSDRVSLSFARTSEEGHFCNAFGSDLPFPNESFDLVFCHYFLLWVKNPVMILKEMARVCKSGGMVVAFAEPDYEARIAYPPELDSPVRLQTDELIRQGINPTAGRQLSSWMENAGFVNPVVGIHGFEWQGEQYKQFLEQEWGQLKKDIHLTEPSELPIRENVIFYTPTFYAYTRL